MACAAAKYNTSTPHEVPLLQIIDPSSLRALEDESAASCSRSAAGVSSTRNAKCTDLGIGGDGTRWRQLVFFPEITWRESSATAANSRSQRLQAELSRCKRLATAAVGGHCTQSLSCRRLASARQLSTACSRSHDPRQLARGSF